MEPTSSQPFGGYAGASGTSYSSESSATGSSFSTTAAHATGGSPYPTDSPAQPADSGVKGKLNDAVASGKKWLSDSGIADKAQQLPKQAKELGNKALTSVSGLSNTQKAVGAGIIAAGVAFLVTRGKKSKSDDGEYRHKIRRSPFDHQPHTKDGDHAYDRKGQRPWGTSRYGTASAPAGKSRVNSGSGYSSSPSSSHSADFGRSASGHEASNGQRRDQGPSAAGSRYDARTSGSQNPNNLDDLNSAF